MRRAIFPISLFAVLVLAWTSVTVASAEEPEVYSTGGEYAFTSIPGVAWFGSDRYMPLEELA